MTRFILFFLVFSISIFAQYTTPGSGVDWSLDSLVTNSGGVVSGAFPNYQVSNKIIISANDKLTILPGSLLTITGATSGFEVNGSFIARGTASDSIIFTSASPDSTGAYDGFRFNDTAVDSESVIEFARIEYAYYAMRCIDASPSIKNSYLFKCRRPVQLSSSDSEILNNKIELAYEYGILINLGSNPLIEGNIISNNNTQAASAKNQISIGLQGNNSPIIKNNIIYGGSGITTGGISLWVNGSSSFSNMIVEGNTIYDNSFGITLLSSSNGIINAVIKGNKIYNNNVNPDVNISGSGININGSSFNTPVITGNEVFGNWWGITIQNGTTVQAGPQPNIGNIENADLDDDGLNIIYNNIQGSNIYDLYNNCTNDIYAQNNDWRDYDSLSIENHIFHKADNAAHGFVNFTPFSNFIPVELVSFSASIIDEKVILQWITASENNNKGFEVYKKPGDRSQNSRDRNQKLEWNKIAFIEGKGTTTEKQSYSFIDNEISSGKFIYRLRQIDFDGSFNLSNEVEIEIIVPDKFELRQNYPNPFNPTTKIKYAVGSKQLATLKVYDILGNEIATLVNKELSPGEYEVEFQSSAGSKQLASGIYIYQLKAGNFISSKKMLLIK